MPDHGYTPANGLHVGGNGSRTAAFVLEDGYSVYGGFPTPSPTNPNPTFSQRDPVAHLTILSGDLAGNDSSPTPDSQDNSFFVLDASASTLFDGFTIEGARAYTEDANSGAGVRIESASPSIRNCIIRDNRTQLISGGHGGGLYCRGGSSPRIENCTFQDNYAYDGGGVRVEYGVNATITGCRFIGNEAQTNAGAINFLQSAGTISNCEFLGNRALGSYPHGGGAINLDTNQGIALVNSKLVGNYAAGDGGAVRLINGATLSALQNLFVGNQSGEHGGAINSVAGGPPSQTVSVTNCTLSGNDAGNEHGGAIHMGGGTLNLVNSILWGNTSDPARTIFLSGGVATVSFSNYEGIAGTAPGPGQISTDPFFVSPSDYHLGGGSPCIDSGNNAPFLSSGITSDLDGLPRFFNSVIDMGAYEFGRASLSDVDSSGFVDTADWAVFQGCISGPGQFHTGSSNCQLTDFDNSGHVDLVDAATLLRCFSGNQPVSDGCAE